MDSTGSAAAFQSLSDSFERSTRSCSRPVVETRNSRESSVEARTGSAAHAPEMRPHCARSMRASLYTGAAVNKMKPLSAAAQATLRQLTITEESPGPILLDFEVFLNFVEERQARVGGTRGLLHGTVLAPL